jgi:methanogenic corrinoid protein MtbC1
MAREWTMQFSGRLKHYRTQMKMSQAALAQALDVTQSAVANYESGTRMPSIMLLQKMAVIFNVPMAELVTPDEIADDMRQLQQEQLEILHMNPDVFYKIQVEKLLNHLMNGQLSDIMHFIVKLHYYELQTSVICDHILSVVLYRIGDLWASGEIDIFQEHFMTEAVNLGMQQLYAKRHPVRDSEPMSFVGVTAPGELHDVGLRMMHLELMQMGWTTYFLGRQTSVHDVILAIKMWQPRVLGISCTMAEHLDQAMAVIQAVRATSFEQHPMILVSGQALRSLRAEEIKLITDFEAESMSAALYQLSALKRGTYGQ